MKTVNLWTTKASKW